ncbi:MAG: ABC transporter ATP-binding protein [Desulfovibrio sp.]|jgi:branched-chain amino acid transport system ATP-binding protein|nr:ABC transporter ATP-binding protein [Desulfovibrio sp.]
MNLLRVENVTKRFGGLAANAGLSFSLQPGQIVGLIGPNGAGKTTLFNCIAGYSPPDEGSVFFDGREITGKPPHEICRLGIARTFQLVKIFARMTVLENIMAGAFLRRVKAADARRRGLDLLKEIGLGDKRDTLCGALPLPDKKMVEVARAMATEPRLLLLDEALAGLTGEEMQRAVRFILKIARNGTAVLAVEHVMEVIMFISDRVVVLDHGVKIAEDIPERVCGNTRVVAAYLGKGYAARK